MLEVEWMGSSNIAHMFFRELKTYNSTNFRTLQKANLDIEDAVTHKAFSSVITRFFIFCEKHPELTDTERRILFFQLKIDMIARYFSEYPDTNLEQLKAFQIELRNYIKDTNDRMDVNEYEYAASV